MFCKRYGKLAYTFQSLNSQYLLNNIIFNNLSWATLREHFSIINKKILGVGIS